MTEPDHVIVLTTLPANADVRAFGSALVEARVAACVNVLPEMTSIYRWQGEVEQEPERQVVIKTTRARLADLRDRVRALHPYEVPEFIVLPIIDGTEAYLKWVRESTAPAATR